MLKQEEMSDLAETTIYHASGGQFCIGGGNQIKLAASH
jgi:hypothetical protein